MRRGWIRKKNAGFCQDEHSVFGAFGRRLADHVSTLYLVGEISIFSNSLVDARSAVTSGCDADLRTESHNVNACYIIVTLN